MWRQLKFIKKHFSSYYKYLAYFPIRFNNRLIFYNTQIIIELYLQHNYLKLLMCILNFKIVLAYNLII